MRVAVVLGGVVLAVVLGAFAGIFSLNSGNWDWWRGFCLLGAAVVGGVTVWIVTRKGPRREPKHAADAGAILGGCVVIAVSAAVAGRSFNDSYYGSPLWPHLCAVTALAGFLAVVVGAARALT